MQQTRKVLAFFIHQLVSTFGVLIVAPVAFVLFADVTRPFGLTVSLRDFHRVLTETPYFPAQITLALAIGWLIGRFVGHRAMLWVWIVPLAVLCLVAAAFLKSGQLVMAQYGGLSSSSMVSHFFGWGCQPTNHCLDQLIITVPFYSAVAYSTGAWLARRMGPVCDFTQFVRSINKRRTTLFIGVPCTCVMLASLSIGLSRSGAKWTLPKVFVDFVWALAEGVIMTFLIAAITKLVGRGSFIVRFFLASDESRV